MHWCKNNLNDCVQNFLQLNNVLGEFVMLSEELLRSRGLLSLDCVLPWLSTLRFVEQVVVGKLSVEACGWV